MDLECEKVEKTTIGPPGQIHPLEGHCQLLPVATSMICVAVVVTGLSSRPLGGMDVSY